MSEDLGKQTAYMQTGLSKRRLSLKWKWAIGTGVGVLLIFIIFSFFVFNSISQVMVSQERSQVNATMNSVISRLQRVSKIDGITVGQYLRPDNAAGNSDQSEQPYSNALLTNLARRDIVVSVYDLKSEQVFSSRRSSEKFKVPTSRTITHPKGSQFNGLIGRAPIRNHEGKLIGYIQVVDTLATVKQTQQKIIWIVVLLTLIAFALISLFGYLLATYLLRPINVMNRTMKEVTEDPQTERRIPDLERNDELSDLAIVFNDMLDRMQRYIDQQHQFVEDVSHELRTPVAVIQGHMEMLNRWGKDDPKILNESLQASLDETKRMQSLVQEMLDLTRADQIEIHFSKEETPVMRVVNQVFNDFKMIHPDFTFTLDSDVHSNPIVQIYRNHLEQVLIILLDNAVKYSTKRKEIHVSAAEDARTVQIAIQDFGEGISEENAKKVFNRFYRVDKARSRDKGGNGLGLSIAQRLIEGYHGKISLESSVGYGSIFRITLPIVKDDPKENLISEEPKD
ncbi:ATP-binding protein [Pediococcus siamensis]|uniref:HAMP domain-containing sensor histidine kinase n=1 Tax=Pediococcus siamensis TaxID=381829 RepID=UPI00399F78A7